MVLLNLRMMEVVVTTGAIRRAKLQSCRRHQQTNTQRFYQPDALPIIQPSVKALKEKYHIPRTCSPQAHRGESSNFVFDHKGKGKGKGKYT